MKKIIVKKIINKMLLAMPLLISAPLVVAFNLNNVSLIRAIRDGKPEEVRDLINGGRIDVNWRDVRNTYNTFLHVAVNNENTAIVNILLNARGIDVNLQDSYGDTPLHCAVVNESTAIVNTLLNARGIEVNKKNQLGATPLHVAVSKGNTAIVNTLLNARGIEVNEKNDQGNTPLHMAVDEGNISIVNTLLNARGIKVNEKNKDNSTPLHKAVCGDSEAIVGLLLDKGADPFANNFDEDTPLYLAGRNGNRAIKRLLEKAIERKNNAYLTNAIRKGEPETVRNLINDERTNVNFHGRNGNTPLHIVAYTGNKTILEILLDEEAEVNGQNELGVTPLHMATFCKKKEVVEILLKRAAKVNLQCKNGDTPLHVAVCNRDGNIVDALLRMTEINVNLQSKSKETPLWIAALENNEYFVRALLEKGAKVNIGCYHGETPLHAAVRNQEEAIVKVLLEVKGIEVNSQDEDGNTPLHIAVSNGNEAIVEALLEKRANPLIKNGKDCTSSDLVKGDGSVNVKRLLEAEIEQIKVNNASLINAINCNDSEAAKKLIKNGRIDGNLQDDNGNTLLRIAVYKENTDIVEALLTVKGIEVNERGGYYNRTPLHQAAFNGNVAIVKALLNKKGADPHIRDFDGYTPLELANNEEIKGLLREAMRRQ